ncbi:expressed unknown protein [Seminavis robusta]|uniref:Uncharacterized protein n=1 Tax=Seminavis robusta TaxID=568900 RepID=A0A9N8HQK3_9STRA|nr:expressed unknown protein [Seminavis robusta]|eukprot:Sro1297_g260450.1 n/a (173) ;mRNA; r:9483-10001
MGRKSKEIDACFVESAMDLIAIGQGRDRRKKSGTSTGSGKMKKKSRPSRVELEDNSGLAGMMGSLTRGSDSSLRGSATSTSTARSGGCADHRRRRSSCVSCARSAKNDLSMSCSSSSSQNTNTLRRMSTREFAGSVAGLEPQQVLEHLEVCAASRRDMSEVSEYLSSIRRSS